MAGETDKTYYPEMTDEQKARLADAKTPEEKRDAYMAISLEIAQRQMKTLGAENTRDESGHVTFNAMPASKEVMDRFPVIDPRGKYGVIDMQFADRMNRIEVTLRMRPPAAEAAIDSITARSAYSELMWNVGLKAKEQRTYQRAIEICKMLVTGGGEDEKKAAADAVQAMNTYVRDSLEGSAEVLEAEKLMSGMECLVGLRSGTVPDEIRKYFHETVRHDLTPELLEECRKQVIPEYGVEISHPYSFTRVALYEVDKPQNWDKSPKDYPDLSPDEIGALIAPYLRATEGRTLDVMFGGVEAQTRYRGTGDAVMSAMDRGDYVIVEGQTAKEHLREMFQKGAFTGADGKPYRKFEQFYAAEGHARVAEYVGGALTVGARVETFLPDENGEIGAVPMRMTAAGFASDSFAPVLLSAWERFWSHFGFYKEKAAQAQDSARYEAAYERVRARHAGAQISSWDDWATEHAKKEFFGDRPLPSQRDTARNYTTDRAALPMFASLLLLADGRYSLKDILDPSKMQDLKRAAGDVVLAHLKPGANGRGDAAWEMQVFERGGANFVRQLDEMSRGFDLANPETYVSAEFRPMLKAFQLGFEAFQEINKLHGVFVDEHLDKRIDELQQQFGACGVLGSAVKGLHTAKAAIVSQTPSTEDYSSDFGQYIASSTIIRETAKRFGELDALAKKTGRQASILDVFTDEFGRKFGKTFQMLTKGCEEAQHLSTLCASDPQKGAELREAVRSGSLMRSVSAQREGDGVKVEMPSAFKPPKQKTTAQARGI